MEILSPEKAAALLLSRIKPIAEPEKVPLEKALGRVLDKDLDAPMESPPFDRSPLDGYALRSADTEGADETKAVRLRVIGTVFAGELFDGDARAGQAVRVMTGAMMPKGCDCVVRQENVELEDEGRVVVVKQRLKKHESYIFKGEDIKKGQNLFEAGRKLTFVELAVLASMGLSEVVVRRHPEIALLCTGDELVPVGKPLPAGKIYNSNAFLIGGRLREMGFSPHILPTGEDNAHDICAEIRSVIGDLDLFLSTGAVSVGEKDIFHEVFPFIGAETLFERLNTRPGGAILCGIYMNKPMICLSGNPFAALADFELIARPAIAKISGRQDLVPVRKTARLSAAIGAKGVRRFVRAVFADGTAAPSPDNLAGQLYSLAGCNCLLDIPACTEAKVGAEVSVLML